MNRYAAALSSHPSAFEAVGEVAGEVLERLDGDPPDLLVCFASPHHVGVFEDVAAGLRKLLDPRALVGCTAVAVAGGGREIEDAPAISVFAARFPAGRVEAFALDAHAAPDGYRVTGWPDDVPDRGTLVMLADPFSFPVPDVLAACNEGAPGLAVVGGLASSARGPGGNRLALGDRVASTGCVAVLCSEEIPVRTVVSQGCRPIGRPLTVTRAERNLLLELAGRPAVERLQEVVVAADEAERDLMRQGLHVGVVVDEHRSDFGRGDFLVRNVLGADRRTGALAVGDVVEVGRTVQFHVRDAASADEDLRHLLAGVEGAGALLFTCNGRGRALFGAPHHDAAAVEEIVGPVPLAGAFCAGEIGPVGGRNFLHGFTASVAVFDR